MNFLTHCRWPISLEFQTIHQQKPRLNHNLNKLTFFILRNTWLIAYITPPVLWNIMECSVLYAYELPLREEQFSSRLSQPHHIHVRITSGLQIYQGGLSALLARHVKMRNSCGTCTSPVNTHVYK